MLEIPINPELPKQRVTVTLAGTVLTFAFAWNTVTESWYMAVEDIEGTVIIRGVRLVVLRWPLSSPQHVWDPLIGQIGRGGGGVILIGLGEKMTADPGRYDLGDSHRLVYVDEADLAELGIQVGDGGG